MIKHLTPRSKWEIISNHIIDFIKSIPKSIRHLFRGKTTDLINVQPLSEPTGMLFYLDYVYKNNKEDDKNKSEDTSAL